MAQKHVYLLERSLDEGGRVNVGVFTSRAKAETFLKRLPMSCMYTIYQLPLNAELSKGRPPEDNQGVFEHWHYGTQVSDYETFNEDGKLAERGKVKELLWRTEIEKIIWPSSK